MRLNHHTLEVGAPDARSPYTLYITVYEPHELERAHLRVAKEARQGHNWEKRGLAKIQRAERRERRKEPFRVSREGYVREVQIS
jgi:hypothetical protein